MLIPLQMISVIIVAMMLIDYMMMKLNMLSYTFAFLLAGFWGILFFGLTSDWEKSVNYIATFFTFGVFGMIFLYLAHPGKAIC